MGGNKKGHRVATAAPARGNSPPRAIPNATVSEGRSFPLRAAPIFPRRARYVSSVLGDLRASRLDHDAPEITQYRIIIHAYPHGHGAGTIALMAISAIGWH